MARTTSPGAEPLQSYPTFWDAVPVDDAAPPVAPPPAPPAADAYLLFADVAEAAPPAGLTVEQTDVG